MHKQRGKPGEMGKAVAIPPDKEAEKKEMFKVIFSVFLHKDYFFFNNLILIRKENLTCYNNVVTGEPIQPDGQRDDKSESELARCQTLCL